MKYELIPDLWGTFEKLQDLKYKISRLQHGSSIHAVFDGRSMNKEFTERVEMMYLDELKEEYLNIKEKLNTVYGILGVPSYDE